MHLDVFISPWCNAIYRGLHCYVALEHLHVFLLDLELSLISIEGRFGT